MEIEKVDYYYGTEKSVFVKITLDQNDKYISTYKQLEEFTQKLEKYLQRLKNEYGKEMTFSEPYYWSGEDETKTNFKCMRIWEISIKDGSDITKTSPDLPVFIKIGIVMSKNYREWRHFFHF